MDQRQDGYLNALTGLGDTAKDKRLGSYFGRGRVLGQAELEAMFRDDAMAAKIVEKLPDEMFRGGFELAGEGLDVEAVMDAVDDENIEALPRLQEAMTWGRLYGGAVAVLGVDDGQTYDKPLRLEAARRLAFVNVLTRWELYPVAWYEDPRLPSFGEAERYRISSSTANAPVLAEIHASRLIRFGAVRVPRRLRAEQQGWDDPVLQRLMDALRGYHHAHDSIEQLLQDYAQAVYLLEGLKELVGRGDEAAIKARLRAIEASRSILNAIILDKNDDWKRMTTSVAGIERLVEGLTSRLTAATDMPHTILLGEAPGASLGEGGQAQKRDWYDAVAAAQKKYLRGPLRRFLTVLMACKEGPTGGKVPEKWQLKFCPLFQPTEKEKAETRKVQADADKIYLDAHVLEPDEVAESRFTDGWSGDTTLKPGRKRERPAPVAPAAPGEDEDEDADDPTDPRADGGKKKGLTWRSW